MIREDYKWSKEYQIMKSYEERPDIYVRFTRTPMTKKIFSGNLQKQNNISILHNDPAGIYAFPIKFVLDYYYNLSKNSFFFSNSYVSFLRDTSKK